MVLCKLVSLSSLSAAASIIVKAMNNALCFC